MKILLTGRNGQVGWELERSLPRLGEVIATDRETLDLADAEAIRRIVRATRPDVIVNAAAYTAVDRAESEPELAMRINARAPAVLAEEAQQTDAILVHYSTDYIFDGTKAGPYTEADAPNPLNVYGVTKLEGEQAVAASGCRHVTFRTSWVYASRGRNFLLTMLKLAQERRTLRVVSDQRGTPTWARDIASATVEVLSRPEVAQQGAMGLYNLAAEGDTTWYGFAQTIFKSPRLAELMIEPPILAAIASESFAAAARRPLNSRLDGSRLAGCIGRRLPAWEHSLEKCMEEIPVGA